MRKRTNRQAKRLSNGLLALAAVLMLAGLTLLIVPAAQQITEVNRDEASYAALREQVKPRLQEAQAASSTEPVLTADAMPIKPINADSPEQEGEEEAKPTGKNSIDHAALQAQNSDYIAWLEIPGTPIEEAIGKNFDGMYLQKGAARPVIQEFGAERVLYVLANTVQRKDWDGRFSRDNKVWAQTVTIPADVVMGTDRRIYFVVESHPAVLDGFIHMAREEVKAMQMEAAKESVHAKLQKPSRLSHSQHTKKHPEMEL